LEKNRIMDTYGLGNYVNWYSIIKKFYNRIKFSTTVDIKEIECFSN